MLRAFWCCETWRFERYSDHRVIRINLFWTYKNIVICIRVVGDQQSACLGHLLSEGEAKCTYGTGCFVLLNTGEKIIKSKHGILTTPCYKLGPKAPTNYALEVK